jgi:hypothetical protein
MSKRVMVAFGVMLSVVCLLQASGGSGGAKNTIRITGIVTAIDPVAQTVTLGTGYYNTGTFKVTSSTKVVRNGVNSTAADIRLGDNGQADVTYPGYEAKKVEVVGAP